MSRQFFLKVEIPFVKYEYLPLPAVVPEIVNLRKPFLCCTTKVAKRVYDLLLHESIINGRKLKAARYNEVKC